MPEPRPSNHDDRGRPVTIRTASNMSHIDTATVVDPADSRPRCRRCGHVVFTAESIRLGIGLACRRALARSNPGVAA